MAREFIYGIDQTRSYDIDFVNWSSLVEGQAAFTLGTLSKKNTGVIKATNKFIKLLLTRVGSDPFEPNRGTYMDDLSYQGGLTDGELGTFISQQIGSALNQIRDIQAGQGLPEDEVITDVQLTSVIRPTVDSVVIKASVTTESGKGVSIRVPVVGG